MTKERARLIAVVLLGLMLTAEASVAVAQSTAFTYQGKLIDAGTPANGNYDFQFKLFDTATVDTGTLQGAMVPVSNLTVTNGIFSVTLDFGAAVFPAANRFLEIAVKAVAAGSFTTLAPRQPINSTPYAIRSLGAAASDGLSVSCVNCVTSSQIASVNGSSVTGAIPVASMPAGSGSYIQNATSPQAASDFNISGTGAANILNATTQYNIGGNRVLSVAGSSNLFAGVQAGLSNTGGSNAFFGNGAGLFNSTGSSNSFFGHLAGTFNSIGDDNAFFGEQAGGGNGNNSNCTAIGSHANFASNTFTNATAIGARAQVSQSNSLVLGSINGTNGATADTNVGIGTTAPTSRLHVAGNALVTGNLNVSGTMNVAAQYQIGASRVLTIQGSGNLFAGIGAGSSNNLGHDNAFFGASAGGGNTTGIGNSFFGGGAGLSNTQGGSNSFFGLGAGSSLTTENNDTLLGASSDGAAGVTNATAIGYRAKVTQSNSMVLGSINGVNGAAADTKVGIGTTSPQQQLSVNSSINLDQAGANAGAFSPGLTFGSFSGEGIASKRTAGGNQFGLDFYTSTANRLAITNSGDIGIGTTIPADKLQVAGDIRVGTGTTGCVKDADGTVIAGACSSDARLKRDVTPFPNLLGQLVRLQPVHFYWRTVEYPDKAFGESRSFGLIAQEVERVLPELVTEDDKGFKVVRYNKLPLLMLQAIKELKTDNDALKRDNDALKQRLEDQEARLRRLEAKPER